MADALTTVSHRQDSISTTTWGGQSFDCQFALEIGITYPPGREDEALKALSDAYLGVVGTINAARPAAAATPQEGTTTP